MKIFDWKELVDFARHNSPYYGELYKGIEKIEKLSDLPVVDQAVFWAANTSKNNRVFTAKQTDGIVFKSGGTTGNPKFSVFSKDEWNLFTKFFGEGMSKGGMLASDRIANLFYAGELYASFIFIMKCIESAPTSALQFPISGSTKLETILQTVQEFDINVLAGLPTTIMNVAEQYSQQKELFPSIKITKILFGGESMYPDQRRRLEALFPGVSIRSIGYASVDAGLLGYFDDSCHADEHRCFGTATVLEIVDDDTNEPITEANKPGKVLLTSLIRGYMPIIRYPVGDRAIWTEEASDSNPDRKFLILGRSEEAARVGPVSVYYEDMRAFLDGLNLEFQVTGFQLCISHSELKDQLTVRIACPNKPVDSGSLDEFIANAFGKERKMFAEAAADNKIHNLKIEWVEPSAFEINPRTGKLRRVIDNRA